MPLHPQTPSSLGSFKSRLVLPIWYRLTQVVLENRLLNWRSSSLGLLSSSFFSFPMGLLLYGGRFNYKWGAYNSIYCTALQCSRREPLGINGRFSFMFLSFTDCLCCCVFFEWHFIDLFSCILTYRLNVFLTNCIKTLKGTLGTKQAWLNLSSSDSELPSRKGNALLMLAL